MAATQARRPASLKVSSPRPCPRAGGGGFGPGFCTTKRLGRRTKSMAQMDHRAPRRFPLGMARVLVQKAAPWPAVAANYSRSSTHTVVSRPPRARPPAEVSAPELETSVIALRRRRRRLSGEGVRMVRACILGELCVIITGYMRVVASP